MRRYSKILLTSSYTPPPKKRQPRKLPPPPESALQIAVAQLLELSCDPEWRWTHFPAGEKRSKITASRLKRFGLKPGWPDFQLVSPDGVFHALELKREGGVLNDAQKDFKLWAIRHEVVYVVARSLADAMLALERWGAIKSPPGGRRTGRAFEITTQGQ